MVQKKLVVNKTDKYDGDRVDLVVCTNTNCQSTKVHFYWLRPPSGCAGGLIVLKCPECDREWIFYDDYA